MAKKRVIVAAAQIPFVSGGAENMVNSLVANLKKRGYDAELVSIPYKWYPEGTLYDSMMAWRMIDLSESDGKKIDLVIATKFPTYGIRHENKVTWLVHQFREAYDLYDNKYGCKYFINGGKIREQVVKFDNTMLPESHVIYTISNNVTKRLKTYNGIDSATLYHPPSMVGRYRFGEYGNYILSVGRLAKLKRNELLIESLRYCDKQIRAKIAGRGPEMDMLKNLAEKMGVGSRVDFLGFVSDDALLDLYSDAFAVYFAPLDEDYGYITLEAFLSKKPVITCDDSGGVLEFVADGRSGFVSAANPELIGTNINKLFADKRLCSSMGTEGFNAVKDISWDNVIDRLTETIR